MPDGATIVHAVPATAPALLISAESRPSRISPQRKSTERRLFLWIELARHRFWFAMFHANAVQQRDQA
jgi:hypothetical protein